MSVPISIPPSLLERLWRNPHQTIEGKAGGVSFRARVGLSNYVDRLKGYYGGLVGADPRGLCEEFELPPLFEQFGFVCDFSEPIELQVYDEGMVLDDGIRAIVQRFGPVMLRNVYLAEGHRSEGHRARFEHLNFHYDRGRHHPDQHSIYIRDPFDSEQREPRGASTIFVPTLVTALQHAKEQGLSKLDASCVQQHYHLFDSEEVLGALGEIILEQSWDAPNGQGEVIAIDNRPIFHASYYPRRFTKGWKIGVRYLK